MALLVHTSLGQTRPRCRSGTAAFCPAVLRLSARRGVRRVLVGGLIIFGLVAGVARVTSEPSLPTPQRQAYLLERDVTDGKTQVEPDSFSWADKTVATFQAWRIFNGGSVALGWATSTDAGRHWRTGTVPLGDYFAASDPVVAFDAVHRVWLIAGIGFRGPYHEVFVAHSPDGLKWSRPVVAAGNIDEDHDKEWVTCDNGARSPYRGRCYLAYVETSLWQLGIRTSDDGGLTWSKPLRLQPGVAGATFSGPIPVTRPNGDLVVPYSFFAPIDGEDRVAAVVSHDGGATFSQTRIAALAAADVIDSIRAPALPTATVEAAGELYVAWQDGRFRSNAGKNDIVISTSPDGTRWTDPVRIPLPRASTYFTPAIAVDPATSGKNAHVAVAYYAMHLSRGCATFVPGCHQEIDAWLIESQNAGRTWSAPQGLDAQPMQIGWLADTTLGAMLGDYISVSFARGKALTVLALAAPPTASGQRESIFTCRPKTSAQRAQTHHSPTCRRPSP
jgi:hypothetical protein